jgi:hypothetical protein
MNYHLNEETEALADQIARARAVLGRFVGGGDVRVVDHLASKGTLLPSSHLAYRWEVSQAEVYIACVRGHVCRLRGSRDWVHPPAMQHVSYQAATAVGRALAGLPELTQFAFWVWRHRPLGSRTVREAADEGHLDAVCLVAKAWSVGG